MRFARHLELFFILALVAGLAVLLGGGGQSQPASAQATSERPIAAKAQSVSVADGDPEADRQAESEAEVESDADSKPESGATPTPTQTRAAAQDDDLLLYLPLDGDARDWGSLSLSTRPTSITYSKDSATDDNGFATFDQDSYISVSDPQAFNGMEEFTLAAWVCPTSLREHLNIISKVTPNRDFNLQVNALGNVATHIALGSYEFCYTEKKLKTKTWTHVAATFKDLTWTIYLDGEVAARTRVDRRPGWTGGYLTIGNLYPSAGESFLGGLDEVRIYKRALTSGEVGNLLRH